jgi:hypothetical protein
MKKIALAIVALVAFASIAGAQQTSAGSFTWTAASGEHQRVVLDKVVAEQGLRVSVEKRAVPNAPYSAEAVNESIQVLPDGNRIVHRTTTRVYRDSAGRTRRETLDENGQVVLITINDPAAGAAFVSDPRNNTVSHSVVKVQTAAGEGTGAGQGTGTSSTMVWTNKEGQTTKVEQLPTPNQGSATGTMSHVTVREGAISGAGGSTVTLTMSDPQGGEVKRHYPTPATAVAGGFVYTNEVVNGETAREDLGQQTIEGVTATGTRTTTVIPAGAIGNEQPIKIMSEEWTSSELQVLVLTKHSDPRTGETTYRLTGINRTEPAKSLFEMPEKK